MELTLKRTNRKSTYTIGQLFIDGTYFCDTLEDTVRELVDKNKDGDFDDPGEGKIKGKTAIPYGKYGVTLNAISTRFKDIEPYKTICQGKVPRLMDVPGFQGVLIHIGNYSTDTEGCILVGFNKVEGTISNSTDTWKKLYEKIKGQIGLTITIE